MPLACPLSRLDYLFIPVPDGLRCLAIAEAVRTGGRLGNWAWVPSGDANRRFLDICNLFRVASGMACRTPSDPLVGVDGPWHFVACCTAAGMADPLFAVCADGELVVARAKAPNGSAWIAAAKAYSKKAKDAESFVVGLLTVTPLTHIAFEHDGTRATDDATEAAGRLAVLGVPVMTAQPLVKRRRLAPGALAVPVDGEAVTWAPVGRFAETGLRERVGGASTTVVRTVGDMLAHAPSTALKAFALTSDALDAVLQIGRNSVTAGAVPPPERGGPAIRAPRVVPAPTDCAPIVPWVPDVDFAESASKDAVLAWVKRGYTAPCTSVADTPLVVAARMLHVHARCGLTPNGSCVLRPGTTQSAPLLLPPAATCR